jgi:hypothetical protein
MVRIQRNDSLFWIEELTEMAKVKMRDIVVLLPGIMGSVLRKDEVDLWAISGQAAWGALKSSGNSFQQLKLDEDEDDPEAEYLDDRIKATRLVNDAHIVPGFVKVDGYTTTKRVITDNFDIIPGNIRENLPANFFEFPYDWRRDNRINAKILKRCLDDRLKEWRAFSGIKEAMEKSENVGMQTFDSHLLRLFKEGTISLEEALQNSDSPNNLKLKINLSEGPGSASFPEKITASKNDLVGSLSLQAIHKDEEQEAAE